ncbi:MAG: pilus assembly protein TadG-related protein, partial [Acidimicrobiia bacterium]
MRIPSFLRRESDERERGATLILVAASMVAFIGMAGLAVDLGWIYLQSSNVKKATEAAALAAVIHMPLAVPQPAGTVILSGLPASDAAEAIALEHGFSAGATTASRWAKATQVRVDISSSTNTFFMA